MSSCGSPTPTATLYQTSTTAIPTVVVNTVTDTVSNLTTTAASTSYYTTTVRIPTSTLFATPTCNVDTTEASVSSRTTRQALTSSTSTQTMTSALATVSDAQGRASVVFVTYTQTLAPPSPVFVTTIASAPSQSASSASEAASSDSSTHVGPIIGGVVAGVSALLLLALLAWCKFGKRKKQDQTALDELFRRSGGAGLSTTETSREVSRNNSNFSKKGYRSSGDAEEEMIESQVGGGLVPTLARAPSSSLYSPDSAGRGAHGTPYSRMSMPSAWPLEVNTQAGVGVSHRPESMLDRSNSDNNGGQQGLAGSAIVTAHSDPSTPHAGAGEGPRSPVSRSQSYNSHQGVVSMPSSPVSPPQHLSSSTQGLGFGAGSPRPLVNSHTISGSHHREASRALQHGLNRPRSIGHIDALASAGLAPLNNWARPNSAYFPTTEQPTPSSPPLRPLSPTQIPSGLAPYRTTSPPPRAMSPPHWRANQKRTSSGGHRTISWSQGKSAQQQHPVSSQSSHQQEPQAFGVQPVRRMTASPPPTNSGVSQNWPPSRYGYLDMHRQQRHGPVPEEVSDIPHSATSPELPLDAAAMKRTSSGNPIEDYHRTMAAQAVKAQRRYSQNTVSGLPSADGNQVSSLADASADVDAPGFWKSPAAAATSANGDAAVKKPQLVHPVAIPPTRPTQAGEDEDESAIDLRDAERQLWGRNHLFVTNAEECATP